MQCDTEQFTQRIRKISGQVAALERMCEEKRSAQDIIQQLVAVRASLGSLAKLVVEAEVKGCLPSGDSSGSVAKLVDSLFKVA